MKHVWNFIKWLADILFGICVIIAVLILVSAIFYPHDNLLLAGVKWLSTKQF